MTAFSSHSDTSISKPDSLQLIIERHVKANLQRRSRELHFISFSLEFHVPSTLTCQCFTPNNNDRLLLFGEPTMFPSWQCGASNRILRDSESGHRIPLSPTSFHKPPSNQMNFCHDRTPPMSITGSALERQADHSGCKCLHLKMKSRCEYIFVYHCLMHYFCAPGIFH